VETSLNPSRAVPFNRWGGAAYILGNVLFIINKLDEMSRVFLSRWMPDVISGQDPLLILIGNAALICGYAAFLRFYTPPLGRSGRAALSLFAWGGILLAAGHTGFISALGELVPPTARPLRRDVFLHHHPGPVRPAHRADLARHPQPAPPGAGATALAPAGDRLLGFTGFFLFSGETVTARSSSSARCSPLA